MDNGRGNRHLNDWNSAGVHLLSSIGAVDFDTTDGTSSEIQGWDLLSILRKIQCDPIFLNEDTYCLCCCKKGRNRDVPQFMPGSPESDTTS